MPKAFTEQSERQQAATLEMVHRSRVAQREADVRLLMSEPWGRRIAQWLIEDLCGVRESVADRNIKDGTCAGLHSWHREGRRDVGIDLSNELQRIAPREFLAMGIEDNQSLLQGLALESAQETSE